MPNDSTSRALIRQMETSAEPKMPRSYNRRSADERLAALEQRIAALKARQASREKKDDPILREIKKLQKRLKSFIQMAHDHKRPDIANGAMGFKAMLDRIVVAEMSDVVTDAPEEDTDEGE